VSVETREGVIETAPTTVIREQPTTIIEERPVVTQPIIEREKIVEKRPSHHLIKVGPVKVF
jgi:hypothetical protein